MPEARTPHPITGRCVCGAVRYQLRELPLFTHACHCLDCQRGSGTAFVMTTFVMRDDLVITRGQPEAQRATSTDYACPACATLIYIDSTRFPSVILKPGTLDDPSIAAPQAHIWVRRKQAWLSLPDNVPQFSEQYDRTTTWPASSVTRFQESL